MNREREFSLEDIDFYGMVVYLFKHIWLVLLAVIGCVLLTKWYYTVTYVPKYTTEATFAVTARVGAEDSYTNLSAAASTATTFQDVFQSELMQDKIKIALGEEDIPMVITADVIQETNIMVVSVTSSTPRNAYQVMKTLIRIYPDISDTVFGNAILQVLKNPEVPYTPSNPQDISLQISNARMGAAVAMVLLILLLYCLRDTVMTESSARKQLDSKLLGVINYEVKNKTLKMKVKRSNKSVLITNPLTSFFFSENMQKLSTKILFQMRKKEGKTLMVTSVAENEGKTTVAANIALSLSMAGHKVLLMDGDYRKPAVSKIMQVKKEEFQDYQEIFTGKATLKDCIYQDTDRKIDLLMCSPMGNNTEKVFEGGRLAQVFEECKKTYEYIIIDTAPFFGMVDSEEMANLADASLLVVQHDRVRVEQINDCIDALEQRHATLVGYILNGMNRYTVRIKQGYGYGYGGYGSYGKYGKYSKYASRRVRE